LDGLLGIDAPIGVTGALFGGNYSRAARSQSLAGSIQTGTAGAAGANDVGRSTGRLEALDVKAHWADMLSLGEQQRLGFARCLYRKPALAVLDEASSALPVSMETRCMEMLREVGCAVVSVGHRVTLLHHHEKLLRLKLDGTATMHAVSG